jgi:hypothetical protein
MTKKLITLLIIIGLTLPPSMSVKAAGESMYLSSSKSVVYQNENVDVSVRMSTGTTKVNAVQANLSYSTSSLQFISITAGSAFEIEAEKSGGGGSVKIGRGTLSPKSGDKLIATVRFKALKSSGTASITWAAGSQLVDDGTPIATSQSGTSFTMAKKPTATTPSTDNNTSNDNNDSSNESSKKKADETKPEISNVAINFNKTAKVTWTTNESSDSTVEYGPTESLGFSVSKSKLVKDHRVALNEKLLAAKTEVYYRVSSKDKAGNLARSDILSFTTPGTVFLLIVTDNQENVLEGAKVFFAGEQFTTDSEGQVQLSAGEGTQTLSVEYNGVTKVYELNLDEADNENTPSFRVKIPESEPIVTGNNLLSFIGGMFIGGVAIAGSNYAYGFVHHKTLANFVKNKLKKDSTLEELEAKVKKTRKK